MNYREIVLRYIDWLTFNFGGDNQTRLNRIREAIVESVENPKLEISQYQSQYEQVFINLLKYNNRCIRGKKQIFREIVMLSLQEANLEISEVCGIKHAFTTGTRIIQ